LGGFCPETFRAFCWHRQMSSNAITIAELFQTVAEKIEFFENNLNLSKPETGSGRG